MNKIMLLTFLILSLKSNFIFAENPTKIKAKRNCDLAFIIDYSLLESQQDLFINILSRTKGYKVDFTEYNLSNFPLEHEFMLHLSVENHFFNFGYYATARLYHRIETSEMPALTAYEERLWGHNPAQAISRTLIGIPACTL